ncbi:MAG: hypothetical protein JXR50_04110 [Prolixibacteraceae bacterium]|nr:hypothetical protein [Prolixibacteraceae bacterium]MBN2648908.1 hypothetical protein [Prolixibacteraceae bacterium]
MNKKIYSITLFAVIMFFAFNAIAVLPELDIPHTFPDDGQEGTFDLNGDGEADILVRYFSLLGDEYSVMLCAYNSNMVIAETGGSSEPYSSLLEAGTSIEGTPPAGASWYSSCVIVAGTTPPSSPGTPVAPTDTYLDEVYEGFIGLKINDSENNGHYTWLQVDIDDDNQKVTFGAAAVAEAPNTAILAGASGEIVPISIIASLFGFFAIGTGLFYRRKRKKA